MISVCEHFFLKGLCDCTVFVLFFFFNFWTKLNFRSRVLFLIFCCITFNCTSAMDGYQNQGSKANKKVQSVGFTKHFSKDFMHPYGETVRPRMGTTAGFNRKLKPFTCEWLARPSVAASKLAATVDANLDKLTDLAPLAEETNLLQSAGKKMKKLAKDILFRCFLFVFCFFYRLFLFAACSSITRSGKNVTKQDVCNLQREALFEDDNLYAIVLNELYVVGASIAKYDVTIEGGQFCTAGFRPLGRFVQYHQVCQGLQVQSKSKNFCELVEPVQTCSGTRKSNANVRFFLLFL